MKRVSLLLVLLMAVPALAATQVDIEIVLDGSGNFELWADSTIGDANGGIAGFNLVLDSYVSFELRMPEGVNSSYVGIGFTTGNNIDFVGNGPVAYSPDPIFAGQNTTSPASVIYDVGAMPMTINWANGTSTFFDAPILMGTGVGSPTVAGCNNLVSAMNLFQAAGNPNNPPPADVVNFTPEPATLALLGLGGLAILRRRR